MNALSLMCILLLIFQSEASSGTVKVSVYYETLCPDCIAFITNQLNTTYKIFGNKFIQLELVPYGNAEEKDVNGTRTFICQHGPRECYGNKVHGCVLNSYPISGGEDFVGCSERSNPPTSQENLKLCASQHDIRWSDIDKCISSARADDIMSSNGKKTRELNPSWVPTIVFNNVFNENDTNEAVNDLKAVVCKYLDHKPDECTSLHDANVIMI